MSRRESFDDDIECLGVFASDGSPSSKKSVNFLSQLQRTCEHFLLNASVEEPNLTKKSIEYADPRDAALQALNSELIGIQTKLVSIVATVRSLACALSAGLRCSGYPSPKTEEWEDEDKKDIDRLEAMVTFLRECHLEENVGVWIRAKEEVEASRFTTADVAGNGEDSSCPPSASSMDRVESTYKEVYSQSNFQTTKVVSHQRGLNVKLFRCNQGSCGSYFRTKRKLSQHLRTAHSTGTQVKDSVMKVTKRIVCRVCGLRFNLRSQIVNHLKSKHHIEITSVDGVHRLRQGSTLWTRQTQSRRFHNKSYRYGPQDFGDFTSYASESQAQFVA